MLTSDLAALGGLALSAFLAATLLPGGSEAVLAGLAYGQLPAYLAQPYLQSGHLQAVLTEQAPDPWQLFIYRPQQGPVSPRVRLVFDHLRACFCDPAQFPQG